MPSRSAPSLSKERLQHSFLDTDNPRQFSVQELLDKLLCNTKVLDGITSLLICFHAGWASTCCFIETNAILQATSLARQSVRLACSQCHVLTTALGR